MNIPSGISMDIRDFLALARERLQEFGIDPDELLAQNKQSGTVDTSGSSARGSGHSESSSPLMKCENNAKSKPADKMKAKAWAQEASNGVTSSPEFPTREQFVNMSKARLLELGVDMDLVHSSEPRNSTHGDRSSFEKAGHKNDDLQAEKRLRDRIALLEKEVQAERQLHDRTKVAMHDFVMANYTMQKCLQLICDRVGQKKFEELIRE
ncbi:hypothetical protein QR680_007958 [Steinernema hermaphroditum]|uniref:Uncharacterized protein n=1 Tax=Steinernema hermaphroditum TaxID=289476 RepID=A0AA39IEV6_9BILA|nr:hypothetical protein QR680_007958 [Steinernema hermaphroditum]